MGGLGGAPEDLAALMRALCQQSVAAGVLFWCQRTAIEFLVRSFNGALREHVLPDLLTFERAAAPPLSLDALALTALEDERGLWLGGQLPSLANAQPQGVSLIVPVHTAQGSGWALVASEEDGVHLEPASFLPELQHTCPVRVRMDRVFFRPDEWLGDAALLQQTEPTRLALGVLYRALLATPAMCW